ncbi:TraB/GumN family protein [Streptomyces kronopolitis]|uniref:hypothetical protein n=1 Tax=Streptomyces kronopolitis TaxID=1612435 RepID=UPI00368B8739
MSRNDPETAEYWENQDLRDSVSIRQVKSLLPEYKRMSLGSMERHRDVVQKLATVAGGGPLEQLRNLLVSYEGVAFGAAHNYNRFWDFVVQNIRHLREMGISTVYLESVRDDAHQELVDSYLATGAMSDELRSFVKRYDAGWNVSGRGLEMFLDVAWRSGIRVRGVDGRPARKRNLGIDNAEQSVFLRAATMNSYCAQVIREDRSSGCHGKYLVELGEAHTGFHPGPPVGFQFDGAHFETTDEYPGVDGILQIPAVGFTSDMNLTALSPSHRERNTSSF